MELDTYPCNEKYGWCQDKFGVSWQVVPSRLDEIMKDPEKAARVMPEIMKMKKLDMVRLLYA